MAANLPPVAPHAAISSVVHKFDRAYNKFTRQDGWRPAGIPDFDPGAAPMCVHDLLEHFPEGTAEVHWEYLALGAAHFIRHSGGYFKRQGTRISQALVAPAFGMLFYHVDKHNLPTAPVPMVAEAFMPLDRLSADQEIQQTLINARAFLKNTYASTLVDASLREALGWMRIGYRRAEEERYLGQNPKDLSKLFFSTQKRIESETARAYRPQRLEVEIDPALYTYSVKVS